MVDHVETGDGRAATRGREQRAQHADRRGLARTIGAEESVDLAGFDVEIDAVHRGHTLELADDRFTTYGGTVHGFSLARGSDARRRANSSRGELLHRPTVAVGIGEEDE